MPTASYRKHPITDFGYQTTGTDFRVQNAAPAFRNLSKEFLAGEMKRDYLSEAVCFLVLVGLSAWPITSMVQALSLLK
jgi:hypothetical protein